MHDFTLIIVWRDANPNRLAELMTALGELVTEFEDIGFDVDPEWEQADWEDEYP